MNQLEKMREKINEIDKRMAELFTERMVTVKRIAEYKKEHGLDIFDPQREQEVVKRNSELIEDATLREYYAAFLRETMAVSKLYQRQLTEK